MIGSPLPSAVGATSGERRVGRFLGDRGSGRATPPAHRSPATLMVVQALTADAAVVDGVGEAGVRGRQQDRPARRIAARPLGRGEHLAVGDRRAIGERDHCRRKAGPVTRDRQRIAIDIVGAMRPSGVLVDSRPPCDRNSEATGASFAGVTSKRKPFGVVSNAPAVRTLKVEIRRSCCRCRPPRGGTAFAPAGQLRSHHHCRPPPGRRRAAACRCVITACRCTRRPASGPRRRR